MSPRRLKWKIMRSVLNTVGRTSQGVSLGFDYGFDSGPMLDYVYENRARGRLVIGRAVDRVYLNAIGWRAIRARKVLLKEVVRREVEDRLTLGRRAVVLDVAAGPGRYLLELCEELRTAGHHSSGVAVTCRDLDTNGLEKGRKEAAQRGLTNVTYEIGDACDPASLATVRPRPDIVVVSGLYELFTDPAPIRSSLRGIHGILPLGGTLVFTTQIRHPQLEMIANVLTNREGKPWVMVCRSAETAEGWAREAGFEVEGSRIEQVGLFAVTVARRRD